MTPRELLIAAKAKIADPKLWLKGQMASRANGDRTTAWDPEATCFCLMGALMSAEGRDKPAEAVSLAAVRALDKIVLECEGYHTGFIAYNDSNPHAKVMSLIDKAIGSLP